MTTPLWQPGHVYVPGDLVQPATTGPTGSSTLVNPDFAAGDLSGWDITREGGAGGTYSAATDRPFAGTHAAKWLGASGSSTGGGTATVWINTAQGVVVPGQSVSASAYIAQDDTGSSQNYGRVRLHWFDAAHAQIGYAEGNVIAGNYSDYRLSSVFATAPAGATYVRMGVWLSANSSGGMRFDNATWTHTAPPSAAGLIFKAVQAAAGHSGSAEPTWPVVNGLTVVDNEVTWEAVQASRVVWQASPILTSGTVEPIWPTQPGTYVSDGTVSWEAISRHVEDAKCPHGKVVAIAASKVYCADGDIIRFSATANPLDWSTESDAGYLPSGLQQSNADDMAVLNLYRSNVAALNPSCFQMWQVDPDPAQMALLDQMEGVGSSWQKAAQPVANDLFYLSQMGVRSIAIAGASTNLQAGDVGMPIDVLVQEALANPDGRPVATYYPGAGQYWLAFRSPETPVPESVVSCWAGQVSAGGVMFLADASFNSELVGASNVSITGWYSGERPFDYPPAIDPEPVDLAGYTLHSADVPLYPTEWALSPAWAADLSECPMGIGQWLVTLDVDGTPYLAAAQITMGY